MNLTPAQRYAADLGQPRFISDPAQATVVAELDRLHGELSIDRARLASSSGSLFRRMLRRDRRTPVEGIYLWGDVGRGKSYLMDLLYDCVPLKLKWRTHFHRFMQSVHKQLRGLDGQSDPLATVARDIAGRARLLCFDEFHVEDVADAMILGRLLTELINRGVAVVATSNVPPNELYKHGLQRERFLPVIDLIEASMSVCGLASGVDYRYRSLREVHRYHQPLGPAADRAMEETFGTLAAGLRTSGALLVNGRPMNPRAHATDVVWFDFADLCAAPRSAADYLEIAERFHSILLSNVPAIQDDDHDVARRLIHLIDVLYDSRRNLVVSAATEPAGIYRGKRLADEFRRTLSRLVEMRSESYLLPSQGATPV